MKYLSTSEVRALELKANDIRQSIIEMLVAAGSGHTAGPLGMADVLTLLYFAVLKHDPKNVDWELIFNSFNVCERLFGKRLPLRANGTNTHHLHVISYLNIREH